MIWPKDNSRTQGKTDTKKNITTSEVKSQIENGLKFNLFLIPRI